MSPEIQPSFTPETPTNPERIIDATHLNPGDQLDLHQSDLPRREAVAQPSDRAIETRPLTPQEQAKIYTMHVIRQRKAKENGLAPDAASLQQNNFDLAG